MSADNSLPKTSATDDKEEMAYWNRVRLRQTLAAITALLIVAGLITLLAAANQYRQARALASWPATSGVIVQSGVEDATMRGRMLYTVPAVRLQYEYMAGGRNYTSDQIRLDSMPIAAASETGERLLSTYPIGASVTVYYDPVDPSRAVLEFPAYGDTATAGLQLLALALVAGVAAWLVGRTTRR